MDSGKELEVWATELAALCCWKGCLDNWTAGNLAKSADWEFMATELTALPLWTWKLLPRLMRAGKRLGVLDWLPPNVPYR
jgi:hypothetical protein